jgi:hypothetical protein
MGLEHPRTCSGCGSVASSITGTTEGRLCPPCLEHWRVASAKRHYAVLAAIQVEYDLEAVARHRRIGAALA